MFADYPSAADVLITNATIPGAMLAKGDRQAIGRFDIRIAGGRVTDISPAGSRSPEGSTIFDMRGGLVLPTFVDIHTHVDKGHIWPRRPNPDGTWMSALLSVAADRETLWKAEDVERRMDFALRCAYAHGTAAIRTHLDSIPPQHEISWDLFERMRDKWAGRIELQAVSLLSPDVLIDPAALDAVARRTQQAGGILGGGRIMNERSKQAMLAVVDKASELGLNVDIHADECLDPSSKVLLHLAEAVLETGYDGNVVAGHCCAIAVQDEATRATTFETVAEAGIGIVSLPMCNLYLMNRDEAGTATPIRRGVTLLKEFAAIGVSVAIASDNTRDPFYAYGDLDALEVLREGARVLHFDHPQDAAWDWARTVTGGAAAMAGFEHRAEIAVDAPADLVLFDARTWTELLSRPQHDRIVLRGGQAIDTTLPDYRELDDLMEV